MNLTLTQKANQISTKFIESLRGRSGGVYMGIIIAALTGFEVFNFSTTDFALRGIFGNQAAAGLSWATILALAFCGMDFAGIAQLLAPHQAGKSAPRDSWFLLGAWVLAAAMNAGLVWWGVCMAVYNQPADSALILDPMTFVTAVPVLVALMVWGIRILIIGALVTSVNQASRSQSKAKSQTFGFRPGAQSVPAGYKPVPAQAHMQQKFHDRQ